MSSRTRITQNSAALRSLHLDARVEIVDLLEYMISRGLEPLIVSTVLNRAVYLEAPDADWFELGAWWTARGGAWSEVFPKRFEWHPMLS